MYKYVIYKLYTWSASKPGATPVADTVLILTVVHLFHFMTLLVFIDRIIVPIHWTNYLKKPYIFLLYFVFFVLYYLLVYNKKRWAAYVDEFSGESEAQKKRGKIYVLAFTLGSMFLYLISLPVLFTISKAIR